MVVSQNRGTPVYTQEYSNPYNYVDPQNGTPNSGNPQIHHGRRALALRALLGAPYRFCEGSSGAFQLQEGNDRKF